MQTVETTVMVRTADRYRVRLTILKVIDGGFAENNVVDVIFRVIREFKRNDATGSWVEAYGSIPPKYKTFATALKKFNNLTANFPRE